MKAAVVGAGVFGCTAAVELARAGVHVDLYERHRDILRAGSGSSCNRLHRGYHYPRALETARATRDAFDVFADAYPAAVHRSARHDYLIAPDGLVTADGYLAFLDRMGLPYKPYPHPGVEVAVTADEALVNVSRLRTLLRDELAAVGVNVRTGTVGGPDMPGYDLTVLATYGQHTNRPLQFEVTEVAVAKLDPTFTGRSYVILDGPFCCLDPLPGTGYHLVYDVVHSVHHTSVGTAPETPDDLAQFVDKGRIYTNRTRFNRMLDTARRFFPNLAASYIASMFTVRAVLPGVDATDERPTLVERDGSNVSILSGKLGTAVTAARQVAAELVAA